MRTFRHGVHPAEEKALTCRRPIERMPFADRFFLPLRQHLGAPSRVLVRQGQRVYRGQPIAEPGGYVSVALHAPATGRVKAIERRASAGGGVEETIILERDPHSPQLLFEEAPLNWEERSPSEILARIQAGGLVGLGGAAFPTHVKLAAPKGKRIEFFLVNGCECEPYLTCDHRVMLERHRSIFTGIRICLKTTRASRAYIGIESNKPDALEILRDAVPADLPCEIVPLRTKYPQGAEKMLIAAVLEREVPSGKLPPEVGAVVSNAATVAAIADLFDFGQPMIERVVTVTGPGIARPANLLVPIGTPLRDVIEYCGGLTEDARQVILGGPMMGVPQASLDVPIVKGASGVLCLTRREVAGAREYPCIRCLRCVDACPLFLNPCRLGALARMKLYDEMEDERLFDCMECGACAYACPSNIPLVQRFRVAKTMIREKRAREEAMAR